MRNALGLMLASLVAALGITAVWFWTSSPRAVLAASGTVGIAQAERNIAPVAAKPRGLRPLCRYRLRPRARGPWLPVRSRSHKR